MLVQCALFLVAVLVLVGKRQREVPRRPLRVWAMDSSKQCAGAGLAHVANMAVATLLARENGGGGGGSGGSDECAFYAVNFFFDVTAGVLLVWGLLQGLERCAARCTGGGAAGEAAAGWPEEGGAGAVPGASAARPAARPFSCCGALRQSGEYAEHPGGPPSCRVFGAQLLSWLGLVACSKLLLAVPMWLLRARVGELGDVLFAPLQADPKVELVVVMVVGPCLLNALQFWVTDNIIRGGRGGGGRSGGGCCCCGGGGQRGRQRRRQQQQQQQQQRGRLRGAAARGGAMLSRLKGGGDRDRHAHTRLADDEDAGGSGGSSRACSPVDAVVELVASRDMAGAATL